MEYSYIDLLCFLFIYSFIGWVVEVLVAYIKYRELRNRGFFNMPFCLSLGVVMDILIIILPTMNMNFLMQYLASTAVCAVITYLPGTVSKRMHRLGKFNEQDNNLLGGNKSAFLSGLIQGLLCMTAALLLQPPLYLLMTVIPRFVKYIFCAVCAVTLLTDYVIIKITLKKGRTQEDLEELVAWHEDGKRQLGERVIASVWKRITKAYPDVSLSDIENDTVFAQGLCVDKMIWVFVIMSIGGELFETLYVWLTTGVLMSRASFIYGPISIVWGCGAVILTLVLQRLKDKEDRYIFLAGCFLGGFYEYSCSVISEVVFDTTFWDYSDMPLNFGGRTNLLFCLFWGILSVWWVKWMFPILSRNIEKIPVVAGKIITYVVLAALILDGLLSGAALLRYVDRIENPEASNVIEEFIDANYPDEMLEQVWPNLELTL